MLFVFSMHVFANRIANNETTNNTATTVSFITSIAAFIGIIVTYLKFKHKLYLQPIITQYFIDNKSEIWLLFLIAHSKR